jgi:hypothetical protein
MTPSDNQAGLIRYFSTVEHKTPPGPRVCARAALFRDTRAMVALERQPPWLAI